LKGFKGDKKIDYRPFRPELFPYDKKYNAEHKDKSDFHVSV
jgi:hypothetical protein